MKSAMGCYNLVAEEDEDPCNVNIQESEGSRDVQGPALEIPEITKKVKIKKVNIRIEANPKVASIGYYWDDEIVGHIADLCRNIRTYSLQSS